MNQDVHTIGELKALIKDLPDEMEVEVISGSMDCFVEFTAGVCSRDADGAYVEPYFLISTEN